MKKLAGLVLVAAVFTGVGLLVGIAAAESEENAGGEAEEVASPSPESSTEIEEEKAPEEKAPKEMTEAELWKKEAEEHLRMAEQLRAQAGEHTKQASKLLSLSKTAKARTTARSVAGRVDVQQQISKLAAEVQSLKKKVAWLENIIRTQVLKRD